MDNNLFYTCSLIEHISRITKNTKKDIVNYLGKDNVKKIYDLADIYHCEDINQVTDEYIKKCNIKTGNYDNTKYEKIPSYFDLGKVYARLVLSLNKNTTEGIVEVLSSWLVSKIDNYSSSLYYESPNYLYECYVENKII